SSLAWGAAYGIFWWFLGPLTLIPLVMGQPVDWSLEAARGLHGAFVGHVWYGLVVGLVYAGADGLWQVLFVGSDPIRREPESPAMRGLNAAQYGAVAGAAAAVPVLLLA